MSTRANVFVDYNGERVQFYHHWDGYPEGVGNFLANILQVATWIASERTTEGVKNQFLELLKLDKGYELEEIGLHGDIEYLYFVKFIDNEKDVITFTKIDWNRGGLGEREYFSRLAKAEKGEKELNLKLEIV